MKRKKNILEEAADKVLEQYDDREFLEKIRAERGPSIIAAQKERKMYRRRTWCYTAVATLVVAMITIMCCFYAFNNDSAENGNYYGATQYLDSSYEEVNNNLNKIKINEVENVRITRVELIEYKETAAYLLNYINYAEFKTLKMVIDIHSKWDYAPINLANYNQTAEINGFTIYYDEVKNDKNSFIIKAYLHIDNIKIHFEYTENSNNEESDFLNTIEMFIG